MSGSNLVVMLAAVWSGFLDTPLYYLNNMVWDLLSAGTSYIDRIAYSIYYASIGAVVFDLNGKITFHLEDFDGPLELLLALVSKHKKLICTISRS